MTSVASPAPEMISIIKDGKVSKVRLLVQGKPTTPGLPTVSLPSSLSNANNAGKYTLMMPNKVPNTTRFEVSANSMKDLLVYKAPEQGVSLPSGSQQRFMTPLRMYAPEGNNGIPRVGTTAKRYIIAPPYKAISSPQTQRLASPVVVSGSKSIPTVIKTVVPSTSGSFSAQIRTTLSQVTSSQSYPKVITTQLPQPIKPQPIKIVTTESTDNSLLDFDEDDDLLDGYDDEILECQECNLLFQTREELELHESQHVGEVNYICDKCGKEFSTRRSLKEHLIDHANEKKFECDGCHKKFDYRDNLIFHMRIHGNLGSYKCPICFKKFGNKSMRDNHVRKHTTQELRNQNFILTNHLNSSKKPKVLDTGGQLFIQTEDGIIQSGSRVMAPSTGKMAVKPFVETEDRNIQWGSKLMVPSTSQMAAKPFVVPSSSQVVGPSSVFSSNRMIVRPSSHSNRLTPSTVVASPPPQITFSDLRPSSHSNRLSPSKVVAPPLPPQIKVRDLLPKEMTSQAQNPHPTFPCNVCLKRFPDRISLETHKLIHITLRKETDQPAKKSQDPVMFVCRWCKKTFNSEHYLRVHETVCLVRKSRSEGQKKSNSGNTVKCAFCQKDYSVKGSKDSGAPSTKFICEPCCNFLARKSQVSGFTPRLENRFICAKCDECFPNEAQLREHLPTHEGQSIKCDKCGLLFPAKSFANHMDKCGHLAARKDITRTGQDLGQMEMNSNYVKKRRTRMLSGHETGKEVGSPGKRSGEMGFPGKRLEDMGFPSKRLPEREVEGNDLMPGRQKIARRGGFRFKVQEPVMPRQSDNTDEDENSRERVADRAGRENESLDGFMRKNGTAYEDEDPTNFTKYPRIAGDEVGMDLLRKRMVTHLSRFKSKPSKNGSKTSNGRQKPNPFVSVPNPYEAGSNSLLTDKDDPFAEDPFAEEEMETEVHIKEEPKDFEGFNEVSSSDQNCTVFSAAVGSGGLPFEIPNKVIKEEKPDDYDFDTGAFDGNFVKVKEEKLGEDVTIKEEETDLGYLGVQIKQEKEESWDEEKERESEEEKEKELEEEEEEKEEWEAEREDIAEEEELGVERDDVGEEEEEEESDETMDMPQNVFALEDFDEEGSSKSEDEEEGELF